MPIRNAIWKAGSQPQPLREARLPDEKTLETMIVAEPGILSDEWMLIGEQVTTPPTATSGSTSPVPATSASAM